MPRASDRIVAGEHGRDTHRIMTCGTLFVGSRATLYRGGLKMSWWKFESWSRRPKPRELRHRIEFIGGPFDGLTHSFAGPEPLLSLLVSAPVIDDDFPVLGEDVEVTSVATYLLQSHDGRWKYLFNGNRDPLRESDHRPHQSE